MGIDYASRVLKVNHAGENGAVNIYRGQILTAHLTARAMIPQLREFQAHEERHRSIFWAELLRRERPRCRSYFLCGLGGLVLGLITGLLGLRAIAATTVAVEHVVLSHLDSQLKTLKGVDVPAFEAVLSIINDERTHYEESVAQTTPDQFWTRLLTPVVSGSTEAVIWLGMRI
jgi:3-demethoxyubiquinol 3-hydroxylase